MLNKEEEKMSIKEIFIRRCVNLLVEEFKNKPEVFKVKANVDIEEIIKENINNPYDYDPKTDPDNNKPGLGHWGND